MEITTALIILIILLFISVAYVQTSRIEQKNYFIENKGQWPSEIKFPVRISSMNAYILVYIGESDFPFTYKYGSTSNFSIN